MREKNSMANLWKFIAALFIMNTHLYHLGSEYGLQYLGHGGWIFVEMFFIYSGYFACAHFTRIEEGNVFVNALKNVWSKFKKIFPYTTASIIILYLLCCVQYFDKGIKAVLESFINIPIDLLLINSLFDIKNINEPLWYLSSFFIVYSLVGTLVFVFLLYKIRNSKLLCRNK